MQFHQPSTLDGRVEKATTLERNDDGSVSAEGFVDGRRTNDGQKISLRPTPNTEGIIHSHPNSNDFNLTPGYANRNVGDHIAVNRGLPNMITRNGNTIVVEKVNGQFRVRTVQGQLTSREIRSTSNVLKKFQNAGN